MTKRLKTFHAQSQSKYSLPTACKDPLPQRQSAARGELDCCSRLEANEIKSWIGEDDNE